MRYRNKILTAVAFAATLFGMISIFTGCSEKARKTNETEDMTIGIDVARYQGTIDWEQVAQSGIDFAMVRVGYRGMEDGQIREDPNGRYNLQEASKAGIPLGVYFFSTAVTEEEAMEEAAWVADLISGYPITYPVAYDCENFNKPESRQFGMSKKVRTDLALTFLNTIEKLGYEGMFYGSKNDMELEKEWIVSEIEAGYKIWVAQYPSEPYPVTPVSTYSGVHHMWQYATDGVIAGISQPVDLNVAYFGYDGIEPARSHKKPEEVEPDAEAMLTFEEVDEIVTAKSETNLRDIPSQGEDSQVVRVLKNGEFARRIAVSSNGWSKLVVDDQICYAVSGYLTTELNAAASSQPQEEDGIETRFTATKRMVTAKDVVNLRKLPSVEHEDAEVIAQLHNGDIAACVGISDNGWAKLEFNGKTCYAVSSYLMDISSAEATETKAEPEIQTQFEPMNDTVTAKLEVNLRSLPSVEDPDCVVVATIHNGDVVKRTGINRDVGWSRVEYQGQTLYCVSSYLTSAE